MPQTSRLKTQAFKGDVGAFPTIEQNLWILWFGAHICIYMHSFLKIGN